ncbi:CU044_2847 family protein [Paractinoplanes ovalisporus]|uniref:CU044_2847 family protein n=1 Tax=Paractinoplanes ovalisporus TaxID=2810368 RepID=UPI003F68DEB7
MSQVVTYRLDDAVEVQFEVDPVAGFVPAGAEEVVVQVRQAIEPAIAAARVVLDRARSLSPDGVEVKFGIKVTGTANWLIAKAATEGNFEVKLSWAGDNGAKDDGD